MPGTDRAAEVVRRAEVQLLREVEEWLEAKDRGEEERAYQIVAYLHGTAAQLMDLRRSLGLPPYRSEAAGDDVELDA